MRVQTASSSCNTREDMPQSNVLSCILKEKETHTDELCGGRQTQYCASAESWLIQVQSTLDSPDKMWQVSKKVCIYRVPKLMISKRDAYVPTIVSLGPYHHNTIPELSRMDQHKLEAVRRMLTRLQIDLTVLIAEIQKLESKIRECYEEPIDLDGKTLSWMLAMDACFILEFFSNSAVKKEESNSDSFGLVFQRTDAKNSTFYAILDDIIKLENQIPLFVLIKILQLEPGMNESAAVKELATMLSKRSMFRGFPFTFSLNDDGESKLKKYMMNERPAYHLLDLYRMVITDILRNSSGESTTPNELDGYNIRDDQEWQWCLTKVELPGWMKTLISMNKPPRPSSPLSTPTAELLQDAGIEFQPGKVRFEKRRFGSTLSLPQIQVLHSTETWLGNLLAYEECQRCSWFPEKTPISDYVILLDQLIDSVKDVSVLRKSLVIENLVGSDEDIARMFNRLGNRVTLGLTSEFVVVISEAKKHYNSQLKVWISQLKEEHFSKPWKFLSIVAAILILGMTAVQTMYTVKK